MHWQLPVALLLTALVCSARSECQAYADAIESFDNRKGTATVAYKVRITSKSDPPPLKASEKKYLEWEILDGVSFVEVGESVSIPNGYKNEVQRQVSRISKVEWLEMAEHSMDKDEWIREELTVPPQHKMTVFQLRLVCGRTEMLLRKAISIMEYI